MVFFYVHASYTIQILSFYYFLVSFLFYLHFFISSLLFSLLWLSMYTDVHFLVIISAFHLSLVTFSLYYCLHFFTASLSFSLSWLSIYTHIYNIVVIFFFHLFCFFLAFPWAIMHGVIVIIFTALNHCLPRSK